MKYSFTPFNNKSWDYFREDFKHQRFMLASLLLVNTPRDPSDKSLPRPPQLFKNRSFCIFGPQHFGTLLLLAIAVKT